MILTPIAKPGEKLGDPNRRVKVFSSDIEGKGAVLLVVTTEGGASDGAEGFFKLAHSEIDELHALIHREAA